MLARCDDHGYYRGELCPECSKKGRYLMSDKELDSVGRVVTGILRHFPDRFGIMMDEHGFVFMDALVEAIRRRRSLSWLKPEHITALSETDAKGRYEIREGEIRATYGHTIDVDLSDLSKENIPERLYYPASEEEAQILAERGIKPADRSFVHLSETVEKAMEAGMVRNESPVILTIRSKEMIDDGLDVLRAGKSVFLVKEVSAQYIIL